MPLGHRALGEGPVSALLDPQESLTELETGLFASTSFVTRPTDTPAHRYIPGFVARNLTLGRRINQAADGQFGSMIEAVHGEIELDNSEGQLDQMVSQFRVDGRRIILKIGSTEITTLGRTQVQPYQMFETVYTTTALDMYHEKSVVRLSLGSLAERLNNRLQNTTYTGAGGATGTSDMAGRTVPTALGRCLNVAAQILDPNVLTFDLHGGSISTVEKVYDMGVELAFAADYPSYTALAAATVPDATYATSLAAGKIKLGSPPAGAITVDLRGDIDNTNLSYVGNHATIMRMILRDYAGFTNAELDLQSFLDLNAIQTWEMGLFFPAGDQSTIAQVIEEIAFSCGAFAGQDRSGLFRVKRLDVPATNADWRFTDRDILIDKFERIRLPYRIPWKAWQVGYSKNWTIQSGGDLASGVTQSRRTFLESEYRFKFAQSTTIALAHRTSSGAPARRSLFLSGDGAQAEADRLQAFYSYGRAMYRFSVKTALFSVEIGQTVRIILDRYDLQNGKNFVVVGIFDDADTAETEITCFG